MSFFKYRTRSLRDLQEREFVTPAERKQLEAAYDFLLRVRSELQYHTNRPVDVLGKNVQPAVATNLGYSDRSPSRRIEKFMRDLYTHMRNVFLTTRTLEQRMALFSPQQTSRLTKLRRLVTGARPRKMPEPVDGFILWPARSAPRTTASSGIHPAGSCASFSTPSSGSCSFSPTSRSSSGASSRSWTGIF